MGITDDVSNLTRRYLKHFAKGASAIYIVPTYVANHVKEYKEPGQWKKSLRGEPARHFIETLGRGIGGGVTLLIAAAPLYIENAQEHTRTIANSVALVAASTNLASLVYEITNRMGNPRHYSGSPTGNIA